MLFTCYLREGVVYIPTMARRMSEPIYTTIEPVAVVRLINTEEVRRALLETIARKNILIPHPDPKALRSPPLILKYAGVKAGPRSFAIRQRGALLKTMEFIRYSTTANILRDTGRKTRRRKFNFRREQRQRVLSTA